VICDFRLSIADLMTESSPIGNRQSQIENPILPTRWQSNGCHRRRLVGAIYAPFAAAAPRRVRPSLAAGTGDLLSPMLLTSPAGLPPAPGSLYGIERPNAPVPRSCQLF